MTVFLLWDIKFVIKHINNFLVKKKHFFVIIFPLFYLSCVVSHNSHVLLYLNSLNPRIKHLDMFWNIWNLIFGGKQKIHNQVVLMVLNKVHSSQDNKNNISNTVTFWNILSRNFIGKWYDDAVSQALKCMCELFVDVWFLYSMKLILYLF